MHKFTCDAGHEHKISAEQDELIQFALGDGPINSDRAIARRDGLLRISERRRLSDDERRILRGCDAVVNINRSLALMNDRDYREVFGPDATVCQIHHNRVTLGDCGCELTFVFDHHKRDQPTKELHAHHPTHICKGHWKDVKLDRDGRFDFKEHTTRVLKQHQAKHKKD